MICDVGSAPTEFAPKGNKASRLSLIVLYNYKCTCMYLTSKSNISESCDYKFTSTHTHANSYSSYLCRRLHKGFIG